MADCWDEFNGAPGLAQERNKIFVAEPSMNHGPVVDRQYPAILTYLLAHAERTQHAMQSYPREFSYIGMQDGSVYQH